MTNIRPANDDSPVTDRPEPKLPLFDSGDPTFASRADRLTDRPDVDTLAETARTYLLKQKCSQEHHDVLAALSELAARAREPRYLGDTAEFWRGEAKAAEADRDDVVAAYGKAMEENRSLARRVTELEREAEDLHDRWQRDVARMSDEVNSRQIASERRLAELEAALYNHGYGPRLCRCEWCAALAGAGGGAPHDFPPDYTGWRPVKGGDGGGADD